MANFLNMFATSLEIHKLKETLNIDKVPWLPIAVKVANVVG